MKIRIMAVTAVVGLAVAAGSFAAVRGTTVAPSPRVAVPVPSLRAAIPVPLTHMGVPAADLVVLKGFYSAALGYQFYRLDADGNTKGQEGFTVPKHMSLVITDVTWWTREIPKGMSQELWLAAAEDGAPLFTDSVVAPVNGRAASSQHLTTGFVVAAGRRLYLRWGSGFESEIWPEAILYGYLVG